MLSLDNGDFGTIKETLLVNVHTLCEAVYNLDIKNNME